MWFLSMIIACHTKPRPAPCARLWSTCKKKKQSGHELYWCYIIQSCLQDESWLNYCDRLYWTIVNSGTRMYPDARINGTCKASGYHQQRCNGHEEIACNGHRLVSQAAVRFGGLKHYCGAQSQWLGRWQQKSTWDGDSNIYDMRAIKCHEVEGKRSWSCLNVRCPKKETLATRSKRMAVFSQGSGTMPAYQLQLELQDSDRFCLHSLWYLWS